MPDLATVTLRDVEILAADTVIHGRGSPPAGDTYSTADLHEMAAAHRELASELKPPATIGHGGALPAVGTLENVRVSADGSRLLTDIVGVPAKFAELVKSRAYASRSVELSRIVSQKTGRAYGKAITALAFLGGAMPAVRTLDEIHALYEGDSELRRVYVLDDGYGGKDDGREYAREFEARFGEVPFFEQQDGFDAETREIAARLQTDPAQVI